MKYWQVAKWLNCASTLKSLIPTHTQNLKVPGCIMSHFLYREVLTWPLKRQSSTPREIPRLVNSESCVHSHLLAMKPPGRHFPSLNFIFLVCEIGTVVPSSLNTVLHLGWRSENVSHWATQALRVSLCETNITSLMISYASLIFSFPSFRMSNYSMHFLPLPPHHTAHSIKLLFFLNLLCPWSLLYSLTVLLAENELLVSRDHLSYQTQNHFYLVISDFHFYSSQD